MKADKQTEAEIKANLQRLTDAYGKRDLQGVLACFASDADVVLYGTGADEKRIGPDQIRAQVERDWAQTETAAMSFAWISVSAAGAMAWAAVDGTFKLRAAGQAMAIPARVSFVFDKRGSQWLIVHSHFSTPASGQEKGRSL